MSADHVDGADVPNPETRITLQDLRAARYCLAGARLFCSQHGLDWAGFVAAGVPVETLRATGDALVEPVIAAALARIAAERGHPLEPTQTLTMVRASASRPPSGPNPDGQ